MTTGGSGVWVIDKAGQHLGDAADDALGRYPVWFPVGGEFVAAIVIAGDRGVVLERAAVATGVESF